MESGWLTFFVAVTATAFVLQLAVLVMMYLQFRQLNERITRVSDELREKVNPILERLQVIVGDSQSRIQSMLGDAAEIAHIARGSAVRMDRVFSEAVDRLRLQIIRTDQILSGALETIDEAGAQMRKTFLGPVQKASAFVRGLQVGIEVLRSGRRPTSEAAREPQDEGLFI
jgi:hypothetical protein